MASLYIAFLLNDWKNLLRERRYIDNTLAQGGIRNTGYGTIWDSVHEQYRRQKKDKAKHRMRII